jgi:hypothetical protein
MDFIFNAVCIIFISAVVVAPALVGIVLLCVCLVDSFADKGYYNAALSHIIPIYLISAICGIVLLPFILYK